jgi:hypothetical protein
MKKLEVKICELLYVVSAHTTRRQWLLRLLVDIIRNVLNELSDIIATFENQNSGHLKTVNFFNAFWHANLALRRVNGINVC